VSENFTLKYGSELHNKIRDAIVARKQLSQQRLAERRSAWAQQEDNYRLYVKTTDSDTTRATLKAQGKPQYVTIEVPYSYAMLLAAHTYLCSVFLSRNPVHQFMARHGQPEHATLGLEALIDYQIQVGQAMPKYFIWLHDMLKYGIGVVGTYWGEDFTQISEIVEEPVTFMGIALSDKTRKVRKIKRARSYAGNRIYNIRPADWLPDPRVSMANFQEGEFCGRIVEVGWNALLRGKDTGRYYNLDEAKKKAKGLSTQRDRGGQSSTIPSAAQEFLPSTLDTEGIKGFYELTEMEVELVPREWKLGQSTMPEKWIFTLVNDECIIESRPCGEYHGKFNFDVLEYEIDGYNLSKRGLMEITKPLNDTLSWLINTHFFNVRKTLNDQMVVDPSRVVMRDLMDPNPGRLIRLRPEAYGSDPSTAIRQLQVVDVTRTHVQDATVIADFLQRITGATDNIMGMVNAGGRKTATEVRSSTTFGVNRLKTLAEYASAVGWGPHAQKLVQNTQQYYDEEQTYRVAGDMAPQVEPFIRVSPESIQGFWDFVPVDGTMPVDRYAMANLWKEILANVRNIPEVAQQYSVAGMFSWMARLAGLRNIEQFRVNVTTPDAITKGLQNGTLAPLPTGTPGAGPADVERVSGPAQVPGMGPVA
jgi:hypothetical protein